MRAASSFAFGDDEEAIEHARMRLGFRRREHDDDLIDVRRDDALALPSAGRAARELRAARKDLGDRPCAARRSSCSSSDVVADGELERLGGRGDGVAAQRAVGALSAVRFL